MNAAQLAHGGAAAGHQQPVFSRTKVFMDTPVTIDVVGEYTSSAVAEAVESAFGWVAEVESICSRFDPGSELMRLCARPGEEVVPVSPLLFAVVEYAVAMANESDGAFDPTVGSAMTLRGFSTNFRSGETVPSGALLGPPAATFRDIELDAASHAITLRRPMTIDLGAVAKGFAIDLASQALQSFPNVSINAGGDLLVRGDSRSGEPWKVGIRHPHEPGALADVLAVSNMAVCTSGDYERRSPADGSGHIIHAGTGESVRHLSSATVVAPSAMVADAFATAAFVLGPERGIQLLERHGLAGLFITPAFEIFETRGFSEYRR